ncbi:hypothetical protein ACFX2F_030722 [Malus domestica]
MDSSRKQQKNTSRITQQESILRNRKKTPQDYQDGSCKERQTTNKKKLHRRRAPVYTNHGTAAAAQINEQINSLQLQTEQPTRRTFTDLGFEKSTLL